MTHATVRGIAATTTVTPADLGGAAVALAAASAANQTVAFLGGGTEIGFGYPPKRVDVLVRTERLARVVEYQPLDMVVEVECGITLDALQRRLAPHGQRLALDVPHPEFATLGGLVATNAFGPRRTRFGSLRDLIVGVTLIRADGARVRGGGKVVKNVAGFDIPKLAVGSLGTLGMIATATLRLHPLPETTLGCKVAVPDGEGVVAVAREIVANQLEPAAMIAVRGTSGYRVDVVFEGFSAGAREQADRFAAIARQRGLAYEDVDPTALAAMDEGLRTHGNVRMRIAVPPADVARMDRDALGPLAAVLSDGRVVLYPTLGVAFVAGYADARDAVVRALLDARRVAEARGGNAVLLEAGDADVAERVDVYGSLPPSFALMRGLKDRFDPAHRLNPGRFLGRL